MDSSLARRMRDDWNARARENAKYYVQNSKADWDDREFFRSGEMNVANDVMPEMHRICGGSRSPLDLNMLEIGCGVGRMTRMLARIFGRVTALDVSDEIIAQATRNLADLTNVRLVLGDGTSLAGLPDNDFDFCFSFIVFQHIPSYEAIWSYCREAHRVLKPGSIFKFQVQGNASASRDNYDTWSGVPLTPEHAEQLAKDCGFAMEDSEGAGTQYYWLTFRKPWA
jgi:ubiquinone/menaquinone biosynthesis C-methylase UbiE